MVSLIDETITVGRVIAFRSKSDKDNTLWTGKISAICDYGLVKHFEDVVPYHSEVKKSDPSIPPVEASSFFILKVFENNLRRIDRVFALEWILPGTLEFLEEGEQITVKVYNRGEDEAQDIVDLLQSNGYLASVVKTGAD